MNKSDYETVIGLEIHAQISTKSKMFCSCANDSSSKEPNFNVCPICMGFPGMLPVINEEAVKRALKTALAFNCEIPKFAKFDRKNYFYPDLPKGFQISQYDEPLSSNGGVEIIVKGKKKKIGIVRVHLEDDAGKLTHIEEGSLCDFNRCGTPLMEIVTKPDLSSVEEASIFAREIQRILRFLGASDCDMEKGMMRFDVNISVRKKGDCKLGTKTEVKNLNSFRTLEKALEYEIKRQIELKKSGKKVIHETLGFDDQKEITVVQRSKEEAMDYRYFPEPDLPPLVSDIQLIAKLKKEIPKLPLPRRIRLVEQYGLSENEAFLLTNTQFLADFFEKTAETSGDPKKTAAFITTILLKHLNQDNLPLENCKIKPEQLGELIKLINQGEISGSLAKTAIFPEMYQTGKNPDIIIKEKGLKQVSDQTELSKICQKVVRENPEVVKSYQSGNERALDALIGPVMKETRGQANPKLVNEILKKLLKT